LLEGLNEVLGKALDFDSHFEIVLKILFAIVRIPLSFWNHLNWYFKVPVYLIILLFTLLIGLIIYKSRYEIL